MSRAPSTSAIREARARAFLEEVKYWETVEGGMLLTPERLRDLREEGWTRSQIDEAIDHLAAAGHVAVDHDGLVVVVMLIKAEEGVA